MKVMTTLSSAWLVVSKYMSFGSERQKSRPHKPQKSSTYHLIKEQLFNWCGPKEPGDLSLRSERQFLHIQSLTNTIELDMKVMTNL